MCPLVHFLHAGRKEFLLNRDIFSCLGDVSCHFKTTGRLSDFQMHTWLAFFRYWCWATSRFGDKRLSEYKRMCERLCCLPPPCVIIVFICVGPAFQIMKEMVVSVKQWNSRRLGLVVWREISFQCGGIGSLLGDFRQEKKILIIFCVNLISNCDFWGKKQTEESELFHFHF